MEADWAKITRGAKTAFFVGGTRCGTFRYHCAIKIFSGEWGSVTTYNK